MCTSVSYENINMIHIQHVKQHKQNERKNSTSSADSTEVAAILSLLSRPSGLRSTDCGLTVGCHDVHFNCETRAQMCRCDVETTSPAVMGADACSEYSMSTHWHGDWQWTNDTKTRRQTRWAPTYATPPASCVFVCVFLTLQPSQHTPWAHWASSFNVQLLALQQSLVHSCKQTHTTTTSTQAQHTPQDEISLYFKSHDYCTGVTIKGLSKMCFCLKKESQRSEGELERALLRERKMAWPTWRHTS